MKRAFTLVETLAALAIFVVLMAMCSAMINSAFRVSHATVQRTGLREEARDIFGRMELDFSSTVRVEAYQINNGTSVFSLLCRSAGAGSVRLQRVDYAVQGNGLFRYVRNIGWNDAQDIGLVPKGNGELLGPSVGALAIEVEMSDGTFVSQVDLPRTRTAIEPAQILIGLAVMDAATRGVRAPASPVLTTQRLMPWVALAPDDEAKGWKVFERGFRLR